jgi:phenylacetic acid degradation operon negative regulatory protein
MVERFGVRAWTKRADDLETGLAASDDLPARFYALTATLQHVRADPLLPPELLPRDWPGTRLRDAYISVRDAFDREVADWFAQRTA